MFRPPATLALGAAGGAVVATVAAAAWLLLRGELDAAALSAAAALGVLAGIAGVVVATRNQRARRSSWIADLPVALIAADGRWQRLSRRLAKQLRTRRNALVGRPLLDRVHPLDRPAIEAWLAAQDRPRATLRFRFLVAPAQPSAADTDVVPTLDAHKAIYLRLRATARRDAAGQLLGWRCWFDNVTGRVHAERVGELRTGELRQLGDQLRHVQDEFDRLKHSYWDLYHNAPVMYFSVDGQGRFVTFNDTLMRTLGYERAELQGRQYQDVIVSSGHTTPVTFSHPSDQEEEWETQWRRKDGTCLDVWIHTVAILDAKGRFVRWRSSALDFTERNRLAHELRARHDELERTNTRLRHINSELEDFTYVVSHDLKEPLRTLQAYSHLLAEEFSSQLGADGFQYINHLVQASQRLGHLIDDLLALSQAGRSTRAPQRFNLIEAVATVRRDLADLIQRREAVILTQGSLPDVVGDLHRITQLLTNLVANGLKYNRTPAPKVVIGQMIDDSDPYRSVVYVRDNGIGIDAKHHEKIFGLFRRLHDDSEYEGTGAGLAICKKIVEAHGGRIWLKSQPEHGATFFFTLPRPVADRPPSKNGASAPRTSVAHAEPAAPRAESVRLLLVEDMTEVAMVIQKLGKRSGLKVTWCDTAEKAWDYLQSHRPDFILLDINLPGMDGLELCRRIRIVMNSRVPIALFSQENRPEELAKMRGIGADHFLSKDLLSRPDVWQQKLTQVLEESGVLV